jgi:stress-induced-phosphoprotein 1
MPNKELAAEAKAKGNKDFQAKNFKAAIEHFTEAIKHDPTDQVFFSNRSACFASLEQYDKALEDGTECVRLKPDWAKGYTRKAHAEFFLKKFDDAAETYKAGLKIAPDDPAMKEGLQKCMDAKYDLPGSGPGGAPSSSPFGSFDMSALASAAAKNPKIKEYMQDQSLMQQVQMVMQLGASNPQMQQQILMQLMQKDPRILEVVMAMQGMDISTVDAANFAEEGEKSAPPPPKPKKEEPPPPPEDLRTPEQKEADEFKAQANELYKQKKFEEALAMYDKAIEKEPNDLVYHNNKCAVWMEMAKTEPEYYDKVLTCIQDLLLRRYEINSANPGGASFEKVAKVITRMAGVYEKKKEWDKAIEMYDKALTEDNNKNARNAKRECERAKEKFEKESYLDPQKAEEHREKGNEFFKAQDFVKAKAEYDEAIKRNPKNAATYSNRAATLTKLGAHPDALKDLDECLKIDPKFVKAYSRKGAAHFFMKEYNKALEAYGKGLALDPDNTACKEGQEAVINKIQETQRSGEVDEEQIAHAMADPEIQNILKDPQINMFLKSLQEDPKSAQAAMNKDAKLANAVSKLMAAGILRTG